MSELEEQEYEYHYYGSLKQFEEEQEDE